MTDSKSTPDTAVKPAEQPAEKPKTADQALSADAKVPRKKKTIRMPKIAGRLFFIITFCKLTVVIALLCALVVQRSGMQRDRKELDLDPRRLTVFDMHKHQPAAGKTFLSRFVLLHSSWLVCFHLHVL